MTYRLKRALVVVAALSWKARAQVGVWRDSVSLFEHALWVTPENDLALNNLGAALVEAGRSEEAIGKYFEILRSDAGAPEVIRQMAGCLRRSGKAQEAEGLLRPRHMMQKKIINPLFIASP